MKIYLASPFFDNKERSTVEEVAYILRGKNLDVFVPMEHKIENGWDMSNEDWGKAVFDMDKNFLDDCDIMVVLYYGLYSDSGTAFEVGYFYSTKKPIICVQLNKEKTSLMIVNSSTVYLQGLDELKNFDFNNIQNSINCKNIEQI